MSAKSELNENKKSSSTLSTQLKLIYFRLQTIYTESQSDDDNYNGNWVVISWANTINILTNETKLYRISTLNANIFNKFYNSEQHV